MKNLLLIFGTRPEAIKMAPLIHEFNQQRRLKKKFKLMVGVSGQHREMLRQTLGFFNIQPDFDLDVMQEDQNIFDITTNCLKGFKEMLKEVNPDLVLVQGDTTTTLTGALAAYYEQIQVAHIEAGLRSGNNHSPYPEEINRKLTGHITDYHFAPTKKAQQNLFREGIKNNVWVVGNTIVDAMFLAKRMMEEDSGLKDKIIDLFSHHGILESESNQSKMILVTCHRRESFGEGLKNVCLAIREIAQRQEDLKIVFPVHLNPNVQQPVNQILKGVKNIHLIEPVQYPYMVWLLNRCHLVLTDSGGIQEEAPSFGKPVLVMREITERTEGIQAGTAQLVGRDPDQIISKTLTLLSDQKAYQQMVKGINPYGDGQSSARIWEILFKSL